MLTRIGLKLIFAVGIVTIIIIGVFSYFNIQSQKEMLMSQAEDHANNLSDAIKNSSHSSMLLNKRDQTHAIINTVGKEPFIREIRLLNKEGMVMFSSNNELIGEMVDKKAESCYACHTAKGCASTEFIPIPQGYWESLIQSTMKNPVGMQIVMHTL
jgi:hypothetical protein